MKNKYTVIFENSFKRERKKMLKQHKDMSKLKTVVDMLANGQTLPPKYRGHNLTGNFIGCRECHIEPDWLLVYKINKNELELILLHTSSHSNLF
ncbi:MAG: type II toxin-antitoxin system YafQ family toxin [Firmicutes bacterium]|nr:type II toxin-antitoxin system YafQ family toxin [Bacillota bacterium]